MVSSSKKKRGKQRKAVKSQAEDTKDLFVVKIDGRTLVEESQHDKCAKLVSLGDNNATNAVKDLFGLIVETTQETHPKLIAAVKHIQRKFGNHLTSPSDDGTYTFVIN